jgi:hypothetical protein
MTSSGGLPQVNRAVAAEADSAVSGQEADHDGERPPERGTTTRTQHGWFTLPQASVRLSRTTRPGGPTTCPAAPLDAQARADARIRSGYDDHR